MNRRFVTVDVFTDRAFGGNPLAVVLDAEGLPDAVMQSVAREFNYAETTFVLPPRDAAHTAQVRIFTPMAEVPFAGHPNVGTAYVLAREQTLGDRLAFEEKAGLVSMAMLRDAAGNVTGAELTTPQPLSRGAVASAEAAASCLGLAPSDIVGTPLVLSVGLPFLVAELADRAALQRARADAAQHAKILPPLGADGVYAFVSRGDTDVAARMFAPLDGVPEDPATGSATAAVMAYLAEERGATRVTFVQGEDMGRPSTLHARVVREAAQVRSVHVAGSCVEMFRGTLPAS